VSDGGDREEVVAEEAGQGDAALPVGGTGEESDERVVAGDAGIASDSLKEMTERIGVERSGLIGLEERERTGSITLRSLGRVAAAMGCKVVYGIVPANGKTLEEMAEERLWREVIGS
jgi:hypothetical protein